MINVYLFIELLGAANSTATVERLKALELANCKLANVVQLSDEKLVAQLDCNSYPDANKAILEKIGPVEGIVQTNIIAAGRLPIAPFVCNAFRQQPEQETSS